MMAGTREKVVSSFTVIKGALVPETYTILGRWKLDASKAINLQDLKRDNSVGARSQTWLRDLAFVISRRFDPEGRDRPLVRLAQGNCDMETWRPLLLWHMTRDEFLLRDFLVDWLFPAYDRGTYRVRTEDVIEYLASVPHRGGQTEHAWSETTRRRVAVALLKIATDFGLLQGTVVRRFASPHLGELPFLYLLHAVSEQEGNAQRVIECKDWRMYLMRPEDVEREILRLHQFRRLQFHRAGSLAQLDLPERSLLEFAERVIA